MNTNYYNLNGSQFMVNTYPTGKAVLRVWNGSGWVTANENKQPNPYWLILSVVPMCQTNHR